MTFKGIWLHFKVISSVLNRDKDVVTLPLSDFYYEPSDQKYDVRSLLENHDFNCNFHLAVKKIFRRTFQKFQYPITSLKYLGYFPPDFDDSKCSPSSDLETVFPRETQE